MNCGCENENKKKENVCMEIVPIFRDLIHEELLEIAQITRNKVFSKGELIYQAGDANRKLFVIHQGKIKISRISSDGKEQVIRVIGAGEFLGELSLFSRIPKNDYAEAMEETSVCILDGDLLKPLLEKYPLIGFKILETMSRRLETAENMIENINLHSVEKRLAEELLRLSDRYNVVELPMSKGDFASQIGMTQETLSRKLAQFQEQKLIRMIGQRKIILINKKGLNEIE